MPTFPDSFAARYQAFLPYLPGGAGGGPSGYADPRARRGPGGTGSVSDPLYDPGDAAAIRLGESTRPQPTTADELKQLADVLVKERLNKRRIDGSANLMMLIAHQEQFASKFGTGLNVFWSRFDEALRDNWINALAMRRSSFTEELLAARKLPLASLAWHIEVDDPKHPDQARASELITKGFDAIPQFQAMRFYLGEDKWQGKYGSQVTWAPVMIDGKPFITVTSHEPVDGDSIIYKYDKTPGILVRTGWLPQGGIDKQWVNQIVSKNELDPAHVNQEWVQQGDRARALFLYDQFWRDHFVISNFNPRSSDYLYEGDKAASIFGVGFRGMLYWDFQLREELRSWLVEALQRIGVNGMLYGFFESGNVAMMNEVIMSLKLIIRDNVTAFPYRQGGEPQKIEHIEPSQVGYDVLAHWINELQETMRRAVLGQSLSSETGSTGMGSEVAELHRTTLENILRSDAAAQQEVLTKDLLGPMIRFNTWTYEGKEYKGALPFRCRFVYSIDKSNAQERSQIYFMSYQMNVPFSKEAYYEDMSITPPKTPEDAIVQPQQAAPQPGQPMGGDGAALPMPGDAAPGGNGAANGVTKPANGTNGTGPMKRFSFTKDASGKLKAHAHAPDIKRRLAAARRTHLTGVFKP
jgi:hypothetical protein